jgi:hypothetical protein
MPTQTLTATQLAVDGTGTNITALLAAPASGTTTLQFANTLNTILLVGATAAAQTVDVEISALLDGETVSNFPPVTLSWTSGTELYSFGPFHSVIDQTGTNLVNVSLGSDTVTDLLVGVITVPGVF